MSVLQEIYSTVKQFSDKGTTHNYIPIYDKLLTPYRNTAQIVVELGVFDGGSLLMWRNFFPKARIIGVDIDPRCGVMTAPRYDISVVLGDASDPNILRKLPSSIDILIDDASHELVSTLNSFKNIYPILNMGGLYVIEDISDIPKWKLAFETTGISFEIIDLRKETGVHDDVLFVFRK